MATFSQSFEVDYTTQRFQSSAISIETANDKFYINWDFTDLNEKDTYLTIPHNTVALPWSHSSFLQKYDFYWAFVQRYRPCHCFKWLTAFRYSLISLLIHPLYSLEWAVAEITFFWFVTFNVLVINMTLLLPRLAFSMPLLVASKYLSVYINFR